MKKIGRLTSEKVIEELIAKAKGSTNFFFINFNKIDAFSFNLMRNNLKNAGASLLVTKNSLLKRVLESLGYENFNELIGLETGVVFASDENVANACKAIASFSKDNENFQLKGGFLGEAPLDRQQLLALAKLPSREVLLSMATSSIASPLTGFLNTLNQITLKCVWFLQALKQKREKVPAEPQVVPERKEAGKQEEKKEELAEEEPKKEEQKPEKQEEKKEEEK